MADQTVAERARLTGLILARGLGGLWRRSSSPLRQISSVRLGALRRLLIAPQDIRTADPTVAADIYAGYFVFDGKVVNAHGNSPFDLPAPSPTWARALAEFGWLRHLRAADTALARANARALVNDWLSAVGRRRSPYDWETRVVARRILAWLSQSPLILEGADGPFYRRFLRSLGRQAGLLHARLSQGLAGEDRLLAEIALTEIGLCADGLDRLLRRAGRWLAEDLEAQILPDGGHVSRNPQVLVDLLLDLLPLRQAFAARGAPAPAPMLNAIDRMMPMLRAFRHGDGTLALFNGMGATQLDLLSTVLAYDDVRGRALTNAPYSGYQRVEAADTLLVADCGPPPPLAASAAAHAGTLAFELSVGLDRMVVNCGAPAGQAESLRDAARATAAHSTLILGDVSSSRFAGHGGALRWLGPVIIAGPGEVQTTRHEDGQGTLIETAHDGYRLKFGWIHHRRFALAADGSALEGLDRLEPRPVRGRTPSALPFAVRFHLHHLVRPVAVQGGLAALVALPNGDRWLFDGGGLPVSIEESISFASTEGPRRIEQLVLHGHTETSREVHWRFARTAPGADGHM